MNNAYRGSGGPDRHRRCKPAYYRWVASPPPNHPCRTDASGRDYYGRSSGPYERPSSHRPREGRPRRLEDVLETDELLSQDAFARYAWDPEVPQGESAYPDYLRRHRRAALERYFARHKGEGW